MEILKDAGRDVHRNRLVICRCDCGGEFIARHSHVKNGNVKRCHVCRGIDAPAPPVAAVPAVAAPVPANTLPEPELETRTVEWYRAEIAVKDEALRKLDLQISDLTVVLAAEGVKPAGFDGDSVAKTFRETVSTAAVMRREKKRLENDLVSLQSKKPETLSPLQSIHQKAAMLRGSK